jgi:hypothetical protein
MKQAQGARVQRPPAWMKRLGAGGFLFFLIKGLLWLMVPAFLAVTGLE